MSISKIVNLQRKAPIPSDGCCGDVRPNPLSEEEGRVQARLFAALGDPTRLRILTLLSVQPAPLCVCEIVTAFPQNQPTISHHLRLLREAELVCWEKRGLWVYYAINSARLAQITGIIQGLQTTQVSNTAT